MLKILDTLIDERPRIENEVLNFNDYLELVRNSPWITRTTPQLLHDMILSFGIEHAISPGKPVKHTYHFFEAPEIVGPFAVFGQQKAKENMVEKFDNAARGGEVWKRLWVLLGTPGSAKSRSMDAIKLGLYNYSRSEEGKTYTLLLPTLDENLFDRALFEENGIHYLQSPLFERPLQTLPDEFRPAFTSALEKEFNQAALEEFLHSHFHYDNDFKVQIDGRISPYSEFVLQSFMRTKGLSLRELMPYLKVKRMFYDTRSKTGIGSYTPRDEKSQEAGSLVGNIDYSLLPRFGSESHPLVHDYKGELCAGANGLVEIHEILKLTDRFLYELLFATQDRFFKPEGQPPIPFNGVIIGHTNFHEYSMFIENRTFEALRSRTTFIEMPLSVDFKDEELIYQNTYSNEKRQWYKERRHQAHVAPHAIELLSLVAVMSRLNASKQNPNLNLLQKALIYAGRSDSGVDNNMARTILDEFEYSKPSEGTFGLDPRFVQNIFETTEHFQINEYAANIQKLSQEGGDRAMLTSIALENPCVTPLDLCLRMEHSLKEMFANQKSLLNNYVDKISCPRPRVGFSVRSPATSTAPFCGMIRF